MLKNPSPELKVRIKDDITRGLSNMNLYNMRVPDKLADIDLEAEINDQIWNLRIVSHNHMLDTYYIKSLSDHWHKNTERYAYIHVSDRKKQKD